MSDDQKSVKEEKTDDQMNKDNKDEDKGDDGKSKQKEYFKEELKRLQTSLDREASKIVPPDEKEHQPYIFNTLEPYYNTKTAEFIIELPEEQRQGWATRETAVGICDPWVDLKMDHTVAALEEPKACNRSEEINKMKTPRSGADKDRPAKEGSTRLPKYPAVHMDASELSQKKLNYADVPMIRDEIKSKIGQNSNQKVENDYTRTKQDFFRMELDKIDDVHPVSRPNMRKAYFAYLQNTPGSKKAIHDCMKEHDKKNKKDTDKDDDKTKENDTNEDNKSENNENRQKSAKSSRPASQRSNKSDKPKETDKKKGDETKEDEKKGDEKKAD